MIEDYQLFNRFPLEVRFRGHKVGCYYADIIVEDCVILELKTVSKLIPEHESQIINYLKASKVKKSLEFDYPPLKVVAFRQIHGFATVISKAFSGKAFSTLPHAEHVVF